MYPYFERPFAKSNCSFQKDFNAQHCLSIMIVKQRKAVDEGGQEHPLLTDLSKTFDCFVLCEFVFQGTEMKNQNKFHLQGVCRDYFWYRLGLHIRTTSFPHLHHQLHF